MTYLANQSAKRSARLWARSMTARFMFEGSKHSESKQEARGHRPRPQSIDNRIREALNAPRMVYMCATLVASLIWLSAPTLARNSFTDYDDVRQVLTFLTDTLPPELKSSDLSAQRKAW